MCVNRSVYSLYINICWHEVGTTDHCPYTLTFTCSTTAYMLTNSNTRNFGCAVDNKLNRRILGRINNLNLLNLSSQCNNTH